MRSYFFIQASMSSINECGICWESVSAVDCILCRRCNTKFHIGCLREAYLTKMNYVQYSKCPYCTNALPIKLRLEFGGGVKAWLEVQYNRLVLEAQEQTDYRDVYRASKIQSTIRIIHDHPTLFQKYLKNENADEQFLLELAEPAYTTVVKVTKNVNLKTLTHTQLRHIGAELIKTKDYQPTIIEIRETDVGPLKPLFKCNKHTLDCPAAVIDETGFCKLCDKRYCIRCHEQLEDSVANHVCNIELRRRATIQNRKALCLICGSFIDTSDWHSYYCKCCASRWLIEKHADSYYIRREPIRSSDLEEYETEVLYSLLGQVTPSDSRLVIRELKLRLQDERYTKILKYLAIAYSTITNYTIFETLKLGTIAARETARFIYLHSKAKDMITALRTDRIKDMIEEIEEELKLIEEMI